MRLRIFFLLCLALLEVQAKQPNVVIIIADVFTDRAIDYIEKNSGEKEVHTEESRG